MDPTAFPTIIFYVMIIVCATIAGAAIVGGIAFWKGKEVADSFVALILGINFIQLLGVFLIVLAACGLRVLDKITAEAVVSILSGVAGYVLGGIKRPIG